MARYVRPFTHRAHEEPGGLRFLMAPGIPAKTLMCFRGPEGPLSEPQRNLAPRCLWRLREGGPR